MISFIDKIFESDKGRRCFESFKKTVDNYSMLDSSKGIVVGFSGGADSVFLLLCLLKLKEERNFSILTLHVNHMIRGEEADRDEIFSRDFCRSLGVDFKSVSVNVPEISEKNGIGIEEAAREARYIEFSKALDENSGFSKIAVAHNATDNLETVIFNMMRGAGIAGLAGIPPVRDNIIRPLISISKSDIASVLDEAGICYVTDSTNNDTEYTRNYIRHEIIPKLNRLASSPESMAARISSNLRSDSEFIDSCVASFMSDNFVSGAVSREALLNSHKAIFYRVLKEMVKEAALRLNLRFVAPEKVHCDKIYERLSGADFSYSLPGDFRFVSSSGKCRITCMDSSDNYGIERTNLGLGVNYIPGYSTIIVISDSKSFECYRNIYKISIQAQLPSDIIIEDLHVRSRCEGDFYRYGGMSRKVKKLFIDSKIPCEKRVDVPLICDSKGIAWIPGFGVRECDCQGESLYIAICEPIPSESSGKKLFIRTFK